MDKEDTTWFEAMKNKGHMPKMEKDSADENERKLDVWVVNHDIHNGPGCEVCDWCCCMHCNGIDDIPECDGCIEGTIISGLIENKE